MTLPRLPFTKALRALLEEHTGRPVGRDGFPRIDAPGSPEHGTRPAPPFYVLNTLPGTVYSGPPFADDHADVEWTYQLDSVSRRADQAEWHRDHARQVLLGRGEDGQSFAVPITVEGMTVIGRRAGADGGPDSADDVVSASEQYTFTITGS